MVSGKFKKGDLVIVDQSGEPMEFEIISPVSTRKGVDPEMDFYYDAKEVVTGKTRTISEDEILRLATPVDNSAKLFRKEK